MAGRTGGAGSVRSAAASLAVLIAPRPHAKDFAFGERRWWWGRAFPPYTNLFLANSHQNSHSPKTKMAADLAAAYIVDFIGVLAPQVGLEPTTLRLTAECSAIELLRSVVRGILHYHVSRERAARQNISRVERSPSSVLALPASRGPAQTIP